MDLSKVETRALVTVMWDRLQIVELFEECCSELRVFDSTRDRYGDRLRGWAADKGWTLTVDNDVRLDMERK